MQYDNLHPAVRVVREGRYTVLVPEVDLVPIGNGDMLHVVNGDGVACGRTGARGEILEGCDPRAIVVLRKTVCGACRNRLGDVPSPKLADEVEGGYEIGMTRTELDRERRDRERHLRVA